MFHVDDASLIPEHSDEEETAAHTGEDNNRKRGTFTDDSRSSDIRPKVLLGRHLVGSAGKSLVDKRKDILSKLSNCTDV